MNNYRIHTLQKPGSYHRFCQDRYQVRHCEDRLILAVSDGHGGKPYTRSGLGARFAAAAAVAVLEGDTESTGVAEEIKLRYDAMVAKHLAFRPLAAWEAARAKDMPPTAVYGATLLAAVITPNGTDLYQLGDGEIHAVDKDGIFLPGLPTDDCCQGNLTTSLAFSHDMALRHFRTVHYDRPVAALMMFSDGCDGAFPSVAHGLTDLKGPDAQLQTMLRRTDRGDDQTFLLAYDTKALATEVFRETLAQSVESLQEAIRREKKKLQAQEEYRQLSAYLNLAVRKAERMTRNHDPELQAFLDSLIPSYQRFRQLQKLLAG